MKIVIRSNVFETNSSSMHSVAYRPKNSEVMFSPEALKEKYKSITDKHISVELDEFGWGYNALRSFEEKLSYVLTSLQYYDNDVDSDNVFSMNNSKYFKWLQELIKDTIDAELDNVDESYNGKSFYDTGAYIDHQSTDTLDDYFYIDEEEFKMKMVQLLFDDGYTIIIDNDNH
jgi:hypothetical protein